MLQTNKSRLVELSLVGEIDSPRCPGVPWTPHLISREGKPTLLPMVGGIVFNVSVGDPALGWAAEGIQPGVSIRNNNDMHHQALKVLSAIGNVAVVMSGMVKGSRGTVTGKSGRFADHVIIDFRSSVLNELAPGDRILIRALGRGLEIEGFPGVQVKNVSPALLEAMGVIASDGKLRTPVVATLPSELMGAGAGLDSDGGCLQIQTGSPEAVQRHGLEGMRLGDVIAIRDYDVTYSPCFMRGAMSIGVVCHGDSVRAGFGPGLTLIMTASHGEIEPVNNPKANIARVLSLGAYR